MLHLALGLEFHRPGQIQLARPGQLPLIQAQSGLLHLQYLLRQTGVKIQAQTLLRQIGRQQQFLRQRIAGYIMRRTQCQIPRNPGRVHAGVDRLQIQVIRMQSKLKLRCCEGIPIRPTAKLTSSP